MSPAPLLSARFANVPAAFIAAAHVSCRFAFAHAAVLFAEVALICSSFDFGKVCFGMDWNWGHIVRRHVENVMI